MKGLENSTYVWLLIIANLLAVFLLLASLYRPRVCRVLFFLLFLWAAVTNCVTLLQSPLVYLEYADLTWSAVYRDFIRGWFAEHIRLFVGIIVICQGLIAISLLLKGWIYTLGSIGGMLFLLAILPLGVGSGFPCSAIMSVSLFILLRKSLTPDQHVSKVNPVQESQPV